MFENWQKMVSNNQKRLLKVDIAKNATPKNQKEQKVSIWKSHEADRESASGVTFKEEKK